MRVDRGWVKSGAARRILVHWADARPAWLWSADGSTLLWRNGAARYFGAKLKKHGLKLAAEPVPIRGQVPRVVRLGSLGRSSLSRIQFLAGGKPASTTCTVTPLELDNGQVGVLIVGVDPIAPEVLAVPIADVDPRRASLLPADAAYLLLGPDDNVLDGSPGAVERLAPIAGSEADEIELEGERLALTRFKASPQGHQFLLVEGRHGAGLSISTVRAEEGIGTSDPEYRPEPAAEEPLLPMGLPPAEPGADTAEDAAEPEPPPERETLSSLFDRLADNEALYGELSAADERFVPPPRLNGGPATPAEPDEADSAPADVVPEAGPSGPARPEPDVIAAVIEFDEDLTEEAPKSQMYRVTGRGFSPIVMNAPGPVEPEASEPEPAGVNAAEAEETEPGTAAEPEQQEMAAAEAPAAEAVAPEQPAAAEPVPEAEAVERVSRYNFDELSRILTDRVSGEPGTDEPPIELDTPIEPIRPPAAVAEGALINIAGETFILNRLPLGIMVFRDQQILFANRALTDLVGYETADGLREAGIAAIFPSEEAASAGPVTHLVRRDGTPIPVAARLQSISWQGRPALMLSAAAAVPQIGHEAAVRTFAELAAGLAGFGFVSAGRSGVVTAISPAGRTVLGRKEDEITGDPLATLVHPDEKTALAQFLERPARFAETARPGIVLKGTTPGIELLLFAEGQAGIVSGYFGFIRARPAAADVLADADEVLDPTMLARVSRGVRRPLNTIIGFADLIRSAAFGTIENHRYLEYARDIKTAGQEIAVLVDELDDFARLRSGTYAARPAELDLGALLESCLVRVRGQAGAAHVLVRSAISERLPHIRADRASLGQAVLNLLASAIDQTPAGGSVILSAQVEEDGSIVVNVRDSGAAGVDPGERFVVFRDGVGKDGEPLAPVRSSVGLALTRSLVSVNGCRISVDPAGPVGTLFSLVIPEDLVAAHPAA